jgi:hypothetical protein
MEPESSDHSDRSEGSTFVERYNEMASRVIERSDEYQRCETHSFCLLPPHLRTVLLALKWDCY